MLSQIGTGSHRYNQGKVRMTYIPPGIHQDLYMYCETQGHDTPVYGLIKLAEHYSLGSAKYPDAVAENGHTFPNWAKGQLFDSMLINSTMRHLYAYRAGEEHDMDFGSHHLIAAAWGFCCLHHQFINYDLYKQYDDRMWVGFSVANIDNESLISLLSAVQVQAEPEDAAILLTRAVYVALATFEEYAPEPDLNFTVNVARLEAIKSKNYGTPNTA
jgi:hypothetical protein